MENIGAKLVRQAAAKTNDLAGDGTTTSVVLAQGLIAEGVKVCSSLKHNSTSINVGRYHFTCSASCNYNFITKLNSGSCLYYSRLMRQL